MRRTIAACFLLFPLFAPQQLPDARELLKQSSAALTTRRSYQYETETTIVTVANGIEQSHQTVTLSESGVNPGKRRIDSKGPIGQATIVSNGEYTWVYLAVFKQYTRKAAADGPHSMFERLARGSLVDLSQAMGTPKTLREESIEIDGSKYSCWVIERKFDKQSIAPPEGLEVIDGVVTVWIDKNLKVERQMTLTGKMRGGRMTVPEELTQRTIKKAIKFDPDLPDSLFSFTPPVNVAEVAEFTIPGMKASNLVGKRAPAFQLKSLTGETFNLSSLKGKVVLLDFWATWCGPCRKEMPTMEKIHQELKGDGLVVLGLDVGEDRETVEKFLKTEKVSYPIALTVGSDVVRSFEVSAYPTYVLIDREGNIAAVQVGSAGEGALRQVLAKGGFKAEPPK